VTRHIVSVGGSGQHIALALTRLVHMGALRRDIKLIAIDPDNQTALPKLLESPGGMRGERHPLQASAVFAPFDITKVGTASFEHMFSDVDHPLEAELFQMMFDADAGSIPISKGMYGTPCVGATVFAEGAGGDGLQNLLKPLSNSNQVFVCGSVVGGTGAGVMHKLIGEIRKYYSGEMYGIFMLPWFEIAAGAAKGAISPAIIQRNAKHGIKYFYEHTIPKLTASLLIGYPGTIQQGLLKPVSVQDGVMGEVPHYLHLAAASAVVQLPNAHTANRGVKAYGIVHDPDNEGWLLDAEWDANTPKLRILLRAHKVLLNLLEFIVLSANEKKILDFYQANQAMRLVSDRTAWGDLHESIAANQGENRQQADFVKNVLAEFALITNEAKFCVNWVNQLFPESVSRVPRDVLLETLSAATAESAESAAHWKRIQSIWRGKALKASANRPRTPAEVARHHAQLILDEGLKVPS
jgi:hypothetical protein